jgi:hypothetical protein
MVFGLGLLVFVKPRQGPRPKTKTVNMNTPFWGNIDRTRLARAYVALAFAQDVAKGYVKEHASAHPILSALDMSAKLLEEILEELLPEEVLATDDTDYTELTM